MELAWANAINKQTLILAPLAVAPQIQEEGAGRTRKSAVKPASVKQEASSRFSQK